MIRRMGLLTVRAWVLSVALLLGRPAFGMQFELLQVSATELLMRGRGPIVIGDRDRLLRAANAIPPGGAGVIALLLDSNGGNVGEAKKMVEIIKARRLTVVIPTNSICASACFLMLAAAPVRLAATDALIGVHSASENGSETDVSLAVTTLMARDAADLGVPANIIGKMVQTTPGRVEWLSPYDLSTMRVTVYDGEFLPAIRRANAIQAQPPAPSGSASAGGGRDPAAAAAGRADRRAWDAWFGTLRGDYRAGAAAVEAGEGTRPRSACYGRENEHRGDFTLGCTVAQQRLAPAFERMRSSPDYAQGWAAARPPLIAGPMAGLGGEAPEQEYKGVYFCGGEVAALTLRLARQSDPGSRRAVLSFGPNALSGPGAAAAPRGSFILEGRFDTGGGPLSLSPTSWISQPDGYHWFGLVGVSDDGGKTFSGTLTDINRCTRFTFSKK